MVASNILDSDISASDDLGQFDMMASYVRIPTGSMCVADSSSKVYSHVRMDAMDKLVKRVTVVQGSGENRHANVVYKSDDDKDEDEDFDMPGPNFKRIEESVRHMLKAQVIAAQDAYQRHLNSVEKGGKSWIYDVPVIS